MSQDKAQLILRASVKELLKRLTAATDAALAMSDADLEYERVHAGPLDGRFVSIINATDTSQITLSDMHLREDACRICGFAHSPAC